MSGKYSVFLTPAEEDYRYLEGMIAGLADRYGGPPFQPHVTLYSGLTDDVPLVAGTVSAVAAEFSPFSLRITGVEATEAYFRSVFVTFETHPSPFRIHDLVKHRLREDSGYRLFPHLSLAYLDVPLAEKQKICAGIVLDRRVIRFDELRVVVPADEEKGWRGTDRWVVGGQSALGREMAGKRGAP